MAPTCTRADDYGDLNEYFKVNELQEKWSLFTFRFEYEEKIVFFNH